MILHGNQRGGGNNLATHLMKTENEHVEIHELRGFVSDNLHGAFKEAYAVSRGTKARQFLFSLSLNPPPEENVSTVVFEDAIERVEQKLGLTGQPRAIVFHEKHGRRHCHAVWSRIDTEVMKAVQLSHSHRKLMDVARELFREHGWQMPRGFMNSHERDPRNFTLAQWQQAKRIGKDPRAIKEAFQECWAISDSGIAFKRAMRERGFVLAKGDRRGFVALDHACEVFAVPKWAGVKTREVRTRFADLEKLPSVDEARKEICHDMAQHLTKLKERNDETVQKRQAELDRTLKEIVCRQKSVRAALREAHHKRREEEQRIRQERFHKGLRGLLDWITGERHRIKACNEAETQQSALRDQQEKDALIFKQLHQRQNLEHRIRRLKDYGQARQESLSQDIEQYRDIRDHNRETAAFSRQAVRRRGSNTPNQER